MTPDQLKQLRKDLSLSVAQASRQVHVTARTWNYWEAGQRAIPEGVIELFCIKNNVEYKAD